MSRSEYDPSIAPVVSAGLKARWMWLMVPVGHAALLFCWFLVSWWWVQPAESDFNFSLDPAALTWMAREAVYQCGVVLVVSCLLLAALPRINWHHAIYVSLASAVAVHVVHVTGAHLRGSITNGEHFMSLVLTNAAVLLISGAFIRRSDAKVA
jgi:hypothetical protein